MRVRFHNRAVKFLDKIDEKDKSRIRLKIKSLVGAIEEQGIIPFKELVLNYVPRKMALKNMVKRKERP